MAVDIKPLLKWQPSCFTRRMEVFRHHLQRCLSVVFAQLISSSFHSSDGTSRTHEIKCLWRRILMYLVMKSEENIKTECTRILPRERNNNQSCLLSKICKCAWNSNERTLQATSKLSLAGRFGPFCKYDMAIDVTDQLQSGVPVLPVIFFTRCKHI